MARYITFVIIAILICVVSITLFFLIPLLLSLFGFMHLAPMVATINVVGSIFFLCIDGLLVVALRVAIRVNRGQGP